ncbi:hypothetical protein HHK36_000594 [Tetracentron sinense]|uniref:RING-type domain-containing protein n=1 Tax=Tetracentron sinense TaxID=13715 RepID=A0A834ZS80_TETSI|nr:hypothetical protein HHK36_000594 [Tetracentron sinense]
MASSQIELGSSPYGCILRDHNWRDSQGSRECNALPQAAFQKNLKEFMRDHLHTCIVLSAPTDSDTVLDENSQHLISNRDCWAGDEERNVCDFRLVSSRDESLAMRRRQSRILDRWAARQAREMITTIERQTHEAELLALSNSQPVSARASTFLRESSPAPSDGSVDIPNLGASSLVQMWREFEVEARLTSKNQSGSTNTNSAISNSGMSNIENSSSIEGHSQGSENCDSADVRYEALMVPDDTFSDWESNRTASSEPLSLLQEQVSDVGENERIGVADIIKRLTLGNRTQSSLTSWSDEIDREQPIVIKTLPQDHSVSDQREQRGYPPIRNRPWVRGRQAIMDLLMQMERERQRELNRLVERRPVSRFSQRGRIQSMLRLRLLRREIAVQDQRHSASTGSELDNLQQGTTIFHPRERFSPRVEGDGRAVPNGGDDSRSPPRDVGNTLHSESTSNQLRTEDVHHQEVFITEQESALKVHHSMTSTNTDLQEEASQISEVMLQRTNLEVTDFDWQGTVNTTTSHGGEGNVVTEEPDPNNHQLIGSTNGTWLSEDLQETSQGSDVVWQGSLEAMHFDWQGTGDAATTSHGWEANVLTEELDPNDQQVIGSTDGTWLSDVSPPQRDWEGSRQALYQDMFENNSDNVEIRELLERRSVSTFLASDFRERMDQLLLSSLQRRRLLMLRSRDWYRDYEVSDDSDQVASTLFQQSLLSQSYYQDSPQSTSFTNRPPHEIELIYDLRGHMAQLHQEMSELRKSIESCMDMQVKLQHSIKQEVSAAVCHSVRREEGKELFNWEPVRKGSCCICYEMQVDSLLYRCGHMCTCFKCANELQWSSGKCPICRAPIVDVVQAYSDS